MKIILWLFFSLILFGCGFDKGRSASQPSATEVANSTGTTKPLTLPTPRTLFGGTLNDKATSLPAPAYPAAARAVKASGTVGVQVLVDEEGKVVSASAFSGHTLLRAAAEQAARKAKFEPIIVDGQAKNISGMLNYTFPP